MDVSPGVWLATLGALGLVLIFDISLVLVRPHIPSMRECGGFVVLYASLAVMFGVGVSAVWGSQRGLEFGAGYLTEYSLSVDNLFVFMVLMARFRVPAVAQQSALLVGIVIALVLRGLLIGVGAAAIERFSWVFYVFGIFLLWTAWTLARGEGSSEEEETAGTAARVTAVLNRLIPTTPEYDGNRVRTTVDSRRVFTPLLVVMVVIGITDLLFALDSIPAIFGLTDQPYLVWTANAFALMGLRQLYFLLGAMLNRLVFLAAGLSVVLAFIGGKLILSALHTNSFGLINGGAPVSWAPVIPIWASLLVIIAVLATVTIASLRVTKNTPEAGSPLA